MNRTQKEQMVAQLREDLTNAKSVILTSYQGIPVNTINELRAKFRAQSVEYHTVKNTLARRAIEGTDKEAITDLLKGPIALAYSLEDAISPAKVVKEFNKENDKFEVRGGILEGELLDEAGVTRLAELPTKDELRVSLLQLFAAGPTQLLRTFTAGPSEFLRVFEAKRMAEEG